MKWDALPGRLDPTREAQNTSTQGLKPLQAKVKEQGSQVTGIETRTGRTEDIIGRWMSNEPPVRELKER